MRISHTGTDRALITLTALAVMAALGCGVLTSSEEQPGGVEPESAPSARAPALEGLPVFPGAEGFGTRTIAGRGGKVLAVTSLDDEGPGTLRAALDETGPRTIVFRVGGIITLKSQLFISQPFVTVAGQTAPGDGIVIKDFGLVIVTNDVLVRHLRVRPGNAGDIDADDNDAIQILGRQREVAGSWNVVLDHVSASWGEDEVVSTWFGPHDITISWSVVSEGLNRSRHPKRTHSAGLYVGDRSDRVSIHHTLLAHNDFRNPLIASGGMHDVVNNVVYDWGTLPTEIFDDVAGTSVNVSGNYYRPGPSTSAPLPILINPPRGAKGARLYLSGNSNNGRLDADNWNLVQFGFGAPRPAPMQYRSADRIATTPISMTDAATALEQVLASAGATAPRRDPIDTRIVEEVKKRLGAIIDSPAQVGGYPPYQTGVPPRDADGDGMPDDWEVKAGLAPRNAADGNGDADGDGYTNLEEYLQALSAGQPLQ